MRPPTLLVDKQRSSHDEMAARIRAVLVVLIALLTILLAWVDTTVAKYGWLLFLFVPLAGERVTQKLEDSRKGATSPAGS